MAFISQYQNGLCLIEDECSSFDLCAFSWYIGNVSERVGKKILMTHAKTPGSFLVLDCSRSDADYILLVNNGRFIFHHDVCVFPDNSCLVGTSSFKNLTSAVYYYTKHKINGVFLYDPTVEAMQLDNEESDIGPPPRVVLEDEEEVKAAQNVKEDVVPEISETNLDINNGLHTCDQYEHNSIQKYPNSNSPSRIDLGSLTCISGTKVSPGFSSFETFKPKVAQNRKQRCDSPVHKSLERKNSDTQKSMPASRLPKPKIYINKIVKQVKPPLVRRSVQLNLSSLTSVKKEDEVTKPKRVPPPVPPRRSSLITISKTSLEEYADKLGTTETEKTEKPRQCNTKSQAKNEKSKYSSKVPVSKLSSLTGIHPSKEIDKIHKGKKGENCKDKSSIRGHRIEKSTRAHKIRNPPSHQPANPKTQIPKHASHERAEKNGHTIMTCANNELENIYKRITKFNWNSNEFSTNPSPLSSLSCSSQGSNITDCHLRASDCTSSNSSVMSSASMISSTDC